MPDTFALPTLLNAIEPHTASLVQDLMAWCAMESPSKDAAATTRMAQRVAAHMAACGAQVTLVPGATTGTLVEAVWPGGPGKPVLLLGHHDTVHPIGSLSKNPPRLSNGRCYGPGGYDMKAGLLMIGTALRVLHSLGWTPRRPVILLSTADEEIGSIESRARIEATARTAEAVLVLEPAFTGGELKTARKGVGTFRLTVGGRPAHAGGAHELGISAITELAHQVLRLVALTDYVRGVTINVGQVEGGTAVNTVAASASAIIDVRVKTAADAGWITNEIMGLQPVLPGTTLTISGGINRPPMERTAATVRLFELARALGRAIGLELHETATGGGSDGNLTSALGIPTLDGLGACGNGAHTDDEYVMVDQLAPRTAVLAGLLCHV